MTLPDLYENSRSKAARAHRRALTPKILAQVTKLGAQVSVLSKETSHYRLTLRNGARVDFWPATLRWSVVGSQLQGDGMRSLAEIIASPPAPPQTVRPVEAFVNIFADASFNHHTLTGGWAAIIAGDAPWIEVFGGLENCPTSTEAELRAIAFGLKEAIAHRYVAPHQRVMLQSDCTQALGIILGNVQGAVFSRGPSDVELVPARRLKPSVRDSHGLRLINSLQAGNSLVLMLRHNRGHTNATNRGKISNRADRLAAAAHRNMKRSLNERT